MKEKYHYTYYSYEEFGRGYIGKRSCHCNPQEDVKYFGSYMDKTFKPTQKIILETYDTVEEAIDDEIKIQRFFKVVENPHFANKAYQTSNGFRGSSESARKGQANRTLEQRSEAARKGYANMTPEQRSEFARIGSIIANAIKFQCTITGFISNAGPLSNYQKARGIDKSNRVRLDQ